MSPPKADVELKVVRTLISKKPKEHGFIIAGLLILISTLVSFQSWEDPSLFEALSSSGEAVFVRGQYARLITSIFLHGDLGHLLSNSYMLFFLSLFVFGTLTQKLSSAFLLLLFSLLMGAVINLLTLHSYEPHIRLVGISGMVYWLAGFWFVNYLFIDRRRKFLGRLVRVIGVSLVVLFPTTFEEQVSYLAHFHGFWVGFLSGFLFFLLFKQRIRSFEELSVEFQDPLQPAQID